MIHFHNMLVILLWFSDNLVSILMIISLLYSLVKNRNYLVNCTFTSEEIESELCGDQGALQKQLHYRNPSVKER